MDSSSLYYKAHITVSAIWLLNHKKSKPPLLSEIAAETGYSLEEVLALCAKLEKKQVIRLVTSGAGERAFVLDPQPLESFPRGGKSTMEKELKDYAEKKQADRESIKIKVKDEKQRKKDLFKALEAKLKEKVKDSPEKEKS